MKLFVYGTLKSDGSLFLGPEYVRNIHPATIKGKLYRYEYVRYPFADIYGDGIIKGEIHEIDPLLLPSIDRIENGYKRKRIITLEGEDVFVYHYPRIDEDYIPIESGVWENRRDYNE